MTTVNDMIPNVSVPEGTSGIYSVRRVVCERSSLSQAMEAMRCYGRSVPNGEYTALYRGNKLMMSDTPNEKGDHVSAVRHAIGNCLIAGLGIGMVLNAVARKPDVTGVTIVELSQDVIDLVAPHYLALYPGRINVVCADILTWKPPRNTHYQMAWFDIWDDLCTDNLREMAKLHRRFCRICDWYGSWAHGFLKAVQYREQRMSRMWGAY